MFDLRTLFLNNMAVNLVLVLVMLYMSFTRKTYPGFGLWTLGMVCLMLGLLLIGLRHYLPGIITVILANGLIFANQILIWIGLDRFLGIRSRIWPPLIGLVASFMLLTYFWLTSPYVFPRIIIVSFVVSAYSFRLFIAARKHLGKVVEGEEKLLMTGFLLIFIFSAMRLAPFLFGGTDQTDFMAYQSSQTLAVTATLLGVLTTVLGMLKVNQQRLEKELNQTKDELDTMRELLPMCSWCKRIRIDDDTWQSVEDFLGAQSQAQVSHSMCPDCLHKYFPEMADSVLRELEKEKK